MRYREIVLETMDQPYRWTKQKFPAYQGLVSWAATFDNDAGETYLVDIWVPRDDRTVDVAFRLLGGSSKWWAASGTGDAFRVMATIRDILLRYIEENEPDTICFESDEPSRTKLYLRMLRNISGYMVDTSKGSVGTKFVLTRNEED